VREVVVMQTGLKPHKNQTAAHLACKGGGGNSNRVKTQGRGWMVAAGKQHKYWGM